MRQIQIRFVRYQFGQNSKPSIALCAREVLGNHRQPSHEGGWSLGWVSAPDLKGRTIWIVTRIGTTESASLSPLMKS